MRFFAFEIRSITINIYSMAFKVTEPKPELELDFCELNLTLSTIAPE